MPEQLPSQLFERIDDSDDAFFYRQPCKTVHIDRRAIAAVSKLYAGLLPKHAALLDLMSGWRSHLPRSLCPREVIGLGMNAQEMADNPHLTGHVVHDLNLTPQLPFESERFDGVICTVSVQYLTRPVEVFREVQRVLKAGAPFIVTFSNRCFPSKAVHIWRSTNERGHACIVRMYFEQSGNWERITVEDRSPRHLIHNYGDPVYAVWAYKPA